MWQRAHIFQHPSLKEIASGHLMGTCQATASRRVGGQREEFLQPAGRRREEGSRGDRPCAGGRKSGREEGSAAGR